MKKRNVWAVTGALGVMALGIGAAVGDSSQNTTDLGSAVTQPNDGGAQRTQIIAPLKLPASFNTAADATNRAPLPTPVPPAPAPVQGNPGWTAPSAPSPVTVPAPVPLPAPVPAPAAPEPVQGDSDWTAASAASSGSAFSAASPD